MIKPLICQQSVLYYLERHTNCSGMLLTYLSIKCTVSITSRISDVVMVKFSHENPHIIALSFLSKCTVRYFFPIYVSFEAMYNSITKV